MDTRNDAKYATSVFLVNPKNKTETGPPIIIIVNKKDVFKKTKSTLVAPLQM